MVSYGWAWRSRHNNCLQQYVGTAEFDDAQLMQYKMKTVGTRRRAAAKLMTASTDGAQPRGGGNAARRVAPKQAHFSHACGFRSEAVPMQCTFCAERRPRRPALNKIGGPHNVLTTRDSLLY